MFTEKNVKIVEKCYRIRNSKFYIQRAMSSMSLEKFLELANNTFIEMFQEEPNFIVRDCPERSNIKLDDFTKMVYNRYKSMCQRCLGAKYSEEPSVKKSKQMISYKKKGITLEMSREQFLGWMLENKHIHDAIVAAGDISSVDRIDDNKGYSVDNIQLLGLHSNIEKRLGKKCKKQTKEEQDKTKEKNLKTYKKAQEGMTEHNKNVVKIQFFPTSKSFDCKIKTISKKRVENHEF